MSQKIENSFFGIGVVIFVDTVGELFLEKF